MADTKVSQLTLIPDIQPNDLLYIIDVDKGTSNRVTFNQLTQTNTSAVSALSTNVVNFQNTVLSLSSDFVNTNINLAPLTTDFLKLSTNLAELSGQFDAGNTLISASEFAFSGSFPVLTGADGGTTTLTFLSGLLLSRT